MSCLHCKTLPWISHSLYGTSWAPGWRSTEVILAVQPHLSRRCYCRRWWGRRWYFTVVCLLTTLVIFCGKRLDLCAYKKTTTRRKTQVTVNWSPWSNSTPPTYFLKTCWRSAKHAEKKYHTTHIFNRRTTVSSHGLIICFWQRVFTKSVIFHNSTVNW